jgi:hypothetical protein
MFAYYKLFIFLETKAKHIFVIILYFLDKKFKHLFVFILLFEIIINIICSSKIVIRHILLKKGNCLRSLYSFSANFRLEIISTADIYRKYLLYEIFCYDNKDKKVLVCR